MAWKRHINSMSASLIVYLLTVLTARIAITNMLSTVQRTIREIADLDSNKVGRAYAQPESMCCPVRIINSFISKHPPKPKAFYMQPLSKTQNDHGTSQLQLVLMHKMVKIGWFVHTLH